MTTVITDVTATTNAWEGFAPGRWQESVDVRDFIQRNYTPYSGDAGFLTGPTARTTAIWRILTAMFPAERERGVHDIDPTTPSSITSHAPGYIDQDNEVIVGLQTDAPLKRAIMPNGGWRMVEDALRTYGYEPDPIVEDDLHHVPQDPQPGRLRRLPARRAAPPGVRTSSPDCRMRTAAAGSSATTDGSRCTAWTRLIAAKQAERADLDAARLRRGRDP